MTTNYFKSFKVVTLQFYSSTKIIRSILQKFYIQVFGVPALGKTLRYGLFLKWLFQQKPEIDSLIDFGCGYGELSVFMAVHGSAVKAIDLNVENLDRIKTFAENHKLNIQVFQKIEPPIQPAKVFLALSVLDYLENPRESITQWGRQIQNKGYLILSFPNQKRKLPSFFENHINKNYVKSGFDQLELQKFIVNCGFSLEHEKKYLPINLFSIQERIAVIFPKPDLFRIIVYPLFLFLSILIIHVFPNSGTETFQVYKKNDT